MEGSANQHDGKHEFYGGERESTRRGRKVFLEGSVRGRQARIKNCFVKICVNSCPFVFRIFGRQIARYFAEISRR